MSELSQAETTFNAAVLLFTIDKGILQLSPSFHMTFHRSFNAANPQPPSPAASVIELSSASDEDYAEL